ncbi:hypothetical protein ACHAWF_018356 [Thalassiosira exigua]
MTSGGAVSAAAVGRGGDGVPSEFGPSLARLGRSLSSDSSGGSGKSGDPAPAPVPSRQERQTCVLTLLRILDNVLSDPSKSNPKVRKIKASNPAFRKRAGRWDGSAEFLRGCGFVGSAGGGAGGAGGVPPLLKLEEEDRDRLRRGRRELVDFAERELGIEGGKLPPCPATADAPNANGRENASGKGDDATQKEKEQGGVEPGQRTKAGSGGSEPGGDSPSDARAVDKGQQQQRAKASSPTSDSMQVESPREPSKPQQSQQPQQPHQEARQVRDGQRLQQRKQHPQDQGQLKHAQHELEQEQTQQMGDRLPCQQQQQQKSQRQKLGETGEQQKTQQHEHRQQQQRQIHQQSKAPLASMSLHEIQMMAQRERDEAAEETKKLKRETAAAQAGRRMNTPEKENISKGEGTKSNGQAAPAASTSYALKDPKIMSSTSPRTSYVLKDENMSTSLSEEMTDLLDEIESELDSSFFNDDDDDDDDAKDAGERERAPSGKKADGAKEADLIVAAAAPAVEEMMAEATAAPSGAANREEVDSGGERRVSHRVRLERERVAEVDRDAFGPGEELGVVSTNPSGGDEPPTDLPEVVEEVASEAGALDADDADVGPGKEGPTAGHSNKLPSQNDGVYCNGSVADDIHGTSGDSAGDDRGHNASVSDLLHDLYSEDDMKAVAIPSACSRPTLDDRSAEEHGVSSHAIFAKENREGDTDIRNGELQQTMAGAISIGNDASSNNVNDVLAAPLPRQPEDESHSNMFRSIPLPEGEFLYEVSDDSEDIAKFRQGFELCHRALLSIWLHQVDDANDVAASRSGAACLTPISNRCSDATSGLSNLKLLDGEEERSKEPTLLVPLPFVYACWTHVLGLDFAVDNVSSTRSTDNSGSGSGKMYSWIVSNHQRLGTLLGDAATTGSESFSNILTDASVSICNYVCETLRSIGLIDLFGAVIEMDKKESVPTELPSIFIGVDGHMQKEGKFAASALLDKRLLLDCHNIMVRLIHPGIMEELAAFDSSNQNGIGGSVPATDRSQLIWYSCQRVIQHLLSSGRIDDARSLLSNGNFINLRLQVNGLLAGTSAHCQDCNALDACLSKLSNECRMRRLRSADPSSAFSSCDGQYLGSARDVAKWKEDFFQILCFMSKVLQDSVSHHRDGSNGLLKDIAEALLLIGAYIDSIGIYRVQEMEQYKEALRLRIATYGDNHELVADILYTMGRHHQRYRRYKFAQKAYEQALRVYRLKFGEEHLRVARVLHNLGVMYHARGEEGVALKCLRKSIFIRTSQITDKAKDGPENDLCIADSYCWIGKISREAQDFDEARRCFLKAHQIKVSVLGKSHVESAEVLHNMGIVCEDLGLHTQREALLIRLANATGPSCDVQGICDVCETLDCIANFHRMKGEYEKALQFFQQCLRRRSRIVILVSEESPSDTTQVSMLLRTYEDVIVLTKKLQHKESQSQKKKEMTGRMGSLLVEMGTLYDHRLNTQSKALVCLQKALQAFRQIKDYRQIGITLSLIGVIHVKRSANQKALKCFRDSLVMRRMSTSGESCEETAAGVADTWHNIGNCEARDGRFDDSLRSYGEALWIKREIFTVEEERSGALSIARTEHCVGLAKLQLGNLDGALESFEDSIKVRRKFLGDSHLDVSFSLHSLGRIYFHQNKIDDAIDCLEEALEIKKAKLPEKHMSLAETEHLLGSLYIKKQQVSAAVPLLKSALVAYRSARGDCEFIKSDVLDLLGSAYMQLGENDHAILSYEHSLKIKKIVVGKDHVACANVLMEIGKLKSLKGDIDGALVAFKEVKRIHKIIYAKTHLKNAELLTEVGLIQGKLENYDMATRCFVEALRMRRKLLDRNHRSIAEALVHTGRTMRQSQGDQAKSLALFQEAIDIYSKSDGGDTSPEFADACRLVGLSQIDNGDNENALSSLQRCLDVREGAFGRNSKQWAEIAYDLGMAKCRAGLHDEAVALLNKFILRQKSVEVSDPERLSNALLHLGKMFLKKRRIDDAAGHFDEALAMRKQMSDNEIGMSEVLFQIGGVRESKKQYLESLVCYEESLKLRLSVSGEDEETADIVYRIGEVHRIRGQFPQALKNFTLALDMYKSSVGETHLSVATTYHKLGYVCDAKNDIQKAMQNHKEGLSVRKNILGGDHVKVASSLDDVAGMYQKQNEQRKALKCLKEALRIRKLQLGNDDIEIGKTLFGMGIIFAAINDQGKAAECYNTSLDISSRLGTNPKLEAQTLHQIGCLHAANCNYREALQNWRTCLSKYREGGLRDDHYMVACTQGNIEMAENVLSAA